MDRKIILLLAGMLSLVTVEANAAFVVPESETELALPTRTFSYLGAGDWIIDYLGSSAGYDNRLFYSVGGRNKFLFDNKPREDSALDTRTKTIHVDAGSFLRFTLKTNARLDDGEFEYSNQWKDTSNQVKWTQVGDGQNYRLYWEDIKLRDSDRDYNDFIFSVSAVPEADPYAMMLAGLGLMGFVASRSSKRKQNS